MHLPVDRLIEQLTMLIGLYNRRSMDLPDGLFGRNAQFRLNGTSFEELLGRAADDALARMLTRGVAGYRFVIDRVDHVDQLACLVVPDGSLAGEDLASSLATRIRDGLRFRTDVRVVDDLGEGEGEGPMVDRRDWS